VEDITFDNNVLTLSNDVTPEAEGRILMTVVDSLVG
jgi:hypothetical protein